MSVVAGGATIINFALLGMWPAKGPIKPLERFYPVIWAGFWVSAFTGVSLFVREASAYGRNPDFYVKLVFVFAGTAILVLMRKRVFHAPRLDQGPVWGSAKVLALTSLACWFGAIVAGRLIAYVGGVF
jgi:hypothetical protein